jgi:predicted aminopeptidase
MKSIFPFDMTNSNLSLLRQFALFALFFLLAGCSSLDYYRNAANGHFEILRKAEPIEEVVSKNTTSPKLKKTLLNMQQARDFASNTLLLPENGSYRQYADIGRECVAWNVVAVEEFSVEPKQWCFPVAGCVSYKGFFASRDAENYAAELQEQGLDTYVAGALAYSTLGWFDDPILSTMLSHSESHCIEVLFHELAHQKLYIASDTDFNEAFATAVAEEGIRRWFAKTNSHKAYEEFLASRQQKNEFNTLILNTREKLNSLYHQKISPEVMRQQKAELFSQLKFDYKEFKKHWNGDDRYDAWMSKELNNAHLALVATYNDLVPIFNLVLLQSNGDMKTFYERISAISSQPFEDRHQTLRRIYAHRVTWVPVTVLP